MALTPAEKRHYKTVERKFEQALKRFIAERDWDTVKAHFIWYGEYLRHNPEALEIQ